MAVPKKRKRLDKQTKPLKNNLASKQAAKIAGRKKEVFSKEAGQKIHTAFEIMDHIEKSDDTSSKNSVEDQQRTRKDESKGTSSKRHGFKFHISLDAVMPEKDSRKDKQDKVRKNKSQLLDIGVTIPFMWNLPIIGGIAQKVIRNIKTIKF